MNSMKNTPSIFTILFTSVLLLTGLQACESQVTTHGNLIEIEELNKVEIGKTSRRDALFLLGPPSFEGAFDSSRLYYNNQKMEAAIAGRTQTIERELIVLIFDDSNTLYSIEIRDKTTDKEIVKLEYKTPSPGNTLSVVNQLFSNLRRR